MGNRRFRWSDMLPNSWFNKLKDMGRASRGQSIRHSTTATRPSATPKPLPPPLQPCPPHRASYYFPSRVQAEQLPRSPFNPKASDIHFPFDPPRKSNLKTRRRPTNPSAMMFSPSVSGNCNCRAAVSSVPKPESALEPESPPFHCDDCKNGNGDEPCKTIIANRLEFDSCRVTSSATDIIIDVGSRSIDMEGLLELRLPPILTKPAKREVGKAELGDERDNGKQGRQSGNGRALKELNRSPARRSASGLHRIKVRPSFPLGSKRVQAYRQQKAVWPKPAVKQSKLLSESFLVVKSSLDPQRDFKESMVEMITENNIRAPKDLEELLVCYLSLNSREYHDVIVEVFEQIWFDLSDNRL